MVNGHRIRKRILGQSLPSSVAKVELAEECMGVTLHQSDQADRQDPKWHTKVKAPVTDILEDPQEGDACRSKEKRSSQEQSNPCCSRKRKRRQHTLRLQTVDIRRFGAQDKQNFSFKHEDQNTGKVQCDKRHRTPSPKPQRQPSPKLEISKRTCKKPFPTR